MGVAEEEGGGVASMLRGAGLQEERVERVVVETRGVVGGGLMVTGHAHHVEEEIGGEVALTVVGSLAAEIESGGETRPPMWRMSRIFPLWVEAPIKAHLPMLGGHDWLKYCLQIF